MVLQQWRGGEQSQEENAVFEMCSRIRATEEIQNRSQMLAARHQSAAEKRIPRVFQKASEGDPSRHNEGNTGPGLNSNHGSYERHKQSQH